MSTLRTQNDRALARHERLWLGPDWDPVRDRARCPACASVDIVGGSCGWCHNEVNENE